MGLEGKTPGRVTTGDCNNANTLDFKANANAYGGGDSMDAYGFAWLFTPAGASPQFVIGSDVSHHLWVNSSPYNDTNPTRSLTPDPERAAPATLSASSRRGPF